MSNLDDSNERVLWLLALKLRVLTAMQIAALQNVREKTATQRMRRLEQRGYVTIGVAMLHPVLSLHVPLYTWRPESSDPFDAGRISWRAQSRWTEPPERTTVVTATKKLADQYGGPSRHEVRARELLHDLHVSELFLRLEATCHDMAASWQSEDALLQQGWARDSILPDAIVRDGTALKAIEFAGSYRAPKIQAFHAAMQVAQLPYELW